MAEHRVWALIDHLSKNKLGPLNKQAATGRVRLFQVVYYICGSPDDECNKLHFKIVCKVGLIENITYYVGWRCFVDSLG